LALEDTFQGDGKMNQSEKPAIYVPSILKHQVKVELNAQINEELRRTSPETLRTLRSLTKKDRRKFYKAQREKILGGRTIQQVLEESREV
jgi:hypothetical protein